jgi:hypothetical protein
MMPLPVYGGGAVLSLGMLQASDVVFVGNTAPVSQWTKLRQQHSRIACLGAWLLLCLCCAELWGRVGRGGGERGGAWWRVPLQQGLGRWARAS